MINDVSRLPGRFYPLVSGVERLEPLLGVGIRFVQLRIKSLPAPERRGQILRARDLCRRHDCTLVVNDYWQDAIDLQCDYVHLGQEDLADADLSALRRHGVRIGISTHDETELDRALACAPTYIALGPIFETSSKTLSWASQGIARITQWRTAIGDLPLVAIGGIGLAQAQAVLAAGADSIAVIGDVANHEDPPARARAWLAATA